MDNHFKRNTTVSRMPSNIISLRQDAAYFFERGVRFLERNDLQRALKAFRKTIEFEPENPVNHCNLAGVLSEMGDFEASNQVLLHVLHDLDPSMAECQFYMANNYANMGKYDAAEEHVLKYLDSEPEGAYAADAEDMLDVLLDEYGGGSAYERWEQARQAEEIEAAKQDGRALLEQGQFEAAVEHLEGLVARESDNLAARNNLSLAYYYTGQHEQAMNMAEHVLTSQPDNVHALCNLAVFCKHTPAHDQLNACVNRLKKVFPLHYDQAMKVGTTLGLVGHHLDALYVFERLARIADRPDPILYHSIAASAANAGRLVTARKWWKVLAQLPGVSDIAGYYLSQLDTALSQGQRFMRVSYQYDLPLQVQFAAMKARLARTDVDVWRKDPLLRASLYWGLRNGTEETRLAVLRTLATIADPDAERALRQFLKRKDIEPSVQAAALFALVRSGVVDPVEIWRNGLLEQLPMASIPQDVILAVEPAWREVWTKASAWLMRHDVDQRIVSRARETWVACLQQTFMRGDVRVAKPEVWAAGLVYVVTHAVAAGYRQIDVASDFTVSLSSLRKAATRLRPFCSE